MLDLLTSFLHRILMCTLFSVLLVLTVFVEAGICATDEDLQSQIREKEEELTLVSKKIDALKKQIEFGTAMGENLRKAKGRISSFLDDLQSSGTTFDDVLKYGKAELKRNVINSKLNPYFHMDENGSLQWGEALMSVPSISGAIPPQFAVGFPSNPSLSPDNIVTTVGDLAEKTRKQREKNVQEAQSLQERRKVLQAELTTLKDKVASGNEESELNSDTARGQLDALKAGVSTVESGVIKFAAAIDRYEADYVRSKQELESRNASLQKSIQRVTNSSTGEIQITFEEMHFGDVEHSSEEIMNAVANLKQVHSEYTKESAVADDLFEKICGYAANADNSSAQSIDEAKQWIKESDTLIDRLKKTEEKIQTKIEQLKNQRKLLHEFMGKLESDLAHLRAVAQLRVDLDQCEKDILRSEEMQKRLDDWFYRLRELSIALSQMIDQDIREADSLKALFKDKNTEFLKEASAILVRIETVDNRFETATAKFYKIRQPHAKPAMVEVECKVANDLLGSNKLTISKVESALSRGKNASAESISTMRSASDAIQRRYYTEKVTQAKICSAKIEDIVSDNDKEATLVLIKVYADRIRDAFARQMAADEICLRAKKLKDSMMGQAQTLEKAETLIGKTLQGAIAIADKCPDVNEPYNIVDLYDKARQIAVEMEPSLEPLRKTNVQVQEHVTIADEAHDKVMKDVKELEQKLSHFRASIIHDLQNGGQEFRNKINSIYVDTVLSIQKIQSTKECYVKSSDNLVARGENAYARAKANIGANAGLPERAKQCIASTEEIMGKYSDAMAAIHVCEYEKAKTIIDGMQAGKRKTEVVTAYDAGTKLENELKAQVNVDAKGKFKLCDYSGALIVLNSALGKAKCAKHVEKINKSIATTEKYIRIETEVKAMVNVNAKAKYKACDYDGSLGILATARGKAKCASQITKINDLISKTENRKTISDKVKKLVNVDAKGAYKKCRFDASLDLLREALDQAKCAKQIGKIGKMIKVVEVKKNYDIDGAIASAMKRQNGENSGDTLAALKNMLGRAVCSDHISKIKSAIAKVSSDSDDPPTTVVAGGGEIDSSQQGGPDDDEVEPFCVVFDLYTHEPKALPSWWSDSAPDNMSKSEKDRFYKKQKNRMEKWINNLSQSKTNIIKSNPDKNVSNNLKKPTIKIATCYSGDALKNIDQGTFQRGGKFAIPIKNTKMTIAYLLKVDRVYHLLQEVYSFHPQFRLKKNKNNIFRINRENCSTVFEGGVAGPVEEGWSRDNLEGSLLITKFGMHIGLAVADAIVPF